MILLGPHFSVLPAEPLFPWYSGFVRRGVEEVRRGPVDTEEGDNLGSLMRMESQCLISFNVKVLPSPREASCPQQVA